MIENIIEVGPELRAYGIGEPDGSRERHIDVPDARPDDDVPPAVSESPRRRDLKGIRIEETGRRRMIDVRITDEVWTVDDRRSRSGNILADDRRQRRSRLRSADRLKLPAPDHVEAASRQVVRAGKG